MKRAALVALILAVGLVVPAFAQRAGGHGGGGFSGGSAFHGGFAAPHFSGGSTARRGYGGFSAARPFRYSPNTARSFRPYSSNSRYRSGYAGPYYSREYRADGFRRPYLNERRSGAFFAIPGWIGLGPVGCYDDGNVYGDWDSDDMDYEGCYSPPVASDDQPVIYGDDGQGEEPPPPPPDQPQYAPPAYQPPAKSSHASPLPTTEVATTIVFKDGRPAEQIHNYALTPNTLYVLDEQRKDIPLAEVDLAATEKANRASGIEFQIPVTAQ